MAEILCLNCKETVNIGENCKCFFYRNDDQQYSLPRQVKLHQKNGENIEAKCECLSTSIDTYSNICSELQQLQIKDYENVEFSKNEYNEETRLSLDLNRIEKFDALTNEKRIKNNFQNQSGQSISSLNCMENKIYFNEFPFKISTKPYEAEYKPEMGFQGNREIAQILTSGFHQQRSCEGGPFNYTDQSLSTEFEMMFHKIYLGEKLHKNTSGAVSQETNLKSNNYSTKSNFSINTPTIFWPISKKLYKNTNNQSEVNLTEYFNFPEVTAPIVHGSMSLVDNVLTLTESMTDAFNGLGPPEGHSDFIISQNIKPIIEEVNECDKQRSCERDLFNYTDQTPYKEREMMWNKNNFPSFDLGVNIHKYNSGSASQETNLEINDFSTTANFSYNTNVWPVTKKSYKNVNDQSEGFLTDYLNYHEVPAPSVHESISLVDEVLESIATMNEANVGLGPPEGHSDFIISQNIKPIIEEVNECEKQRSCERDLFNYTDQTPNKEREMMWNKNYFPSFYLGENIHNYTSGARSQEANLKINDYSTKENFSINTNVWPANKKSYKNVNDQLEINLTESLNLPQVPAPSVHESISLVDKLLESIATMKDANVGLGSPEGPSDFIISQNIKPIFEEIYECDKQRCCERDLSNYTAQTPSKESEKMCQKNYFPSFYLGENIHQFTSEAASQETNLETNNFSTSANFSYSTNFWPVTKKSIKNVNDQSEEYLTDTLSFPEVPAPSVWESISLVDKVPESIGSMKVENKLMVTSKNDSDSIIAQNTKSINEKTYECDNSEQSIFNLKSLLQKFKSDFANNVINCYKSQKFISRRDQLATNKRKDTLEKQFVCNICKKKFPWKYKLTNHYRIHFNENPFVCDVCKKGFKQKQHLTRHYRMHTKEKPFVSNKCGREFSQKNNLVIHYRTHTGEKPYECGGCKKRFARTQDLNYHYQTHTNVKPFVCDRCNKAFNRKWDLKTHYRIHTNEMPFQCNFCEKRFKHRSSLGVHHRTHTGEKPFKCDMCEKKFSQKCDLDTHNCTHKGEKLSA